MIRLAAYGISLAFYVVIGLVSWCIALALGAGMLTAMLITIGLNTIGAVGADAFFTWRRKVNAQKLYEKKKAFLRSMGIDVDALEAEAETQHKARQAKRQEAAN